MGWGFERVTGLAGTPRVCMPGVFRRCPRRGDLLRSPTCSRFCDVRFKRLLACSGPRALVRVEMLQLRVSATSCSFWSWGRRSWPRRFSPA